MKSLLQIVPKKRLGLVCIEHIKTKEVERMSWLDANELVNEGVAKFVSKTKFKEFKHGSTKAVKNEEVITSEVVEDKPKKKSKKIK